MRERVKQKIPHCKQENDWYCGPATLQALLASFDIHMSQRVLAGKCHAIKNKGTSNSDLTKTLRDFNFHVLAREHGTWHMINHSLMSEERVVVGWYSDYIPPFAYHFSIVSKLTKDSIFLMDPDIGKIRRMKWGDFVMRWHDFDSKKQKPLVRWFLAVSQR